MALNLITETLTDKGNKIAIYEKSDRINGETITSYEVVRKRWIDERILKGKVLPCGFKYPSSEQWGVDGYTAISIERAQYLQNRLIRLDNKVK